MKNSAEPMVTSDRLDPGTGFGSFESVLSNPEITGPFDSFTFCAANGRQVLLGHKPFGAGELADDQSEIQISSRPAVNTVFMTKDVIYHRGARTWEEVRKLMAEGYVFGTARHPNIKVWVAGTSRNSRLAPERIFVLP